ncbi:hypothetical protein Bealeia1_01156 [Candidatus Bealeia paramacronuclearis]|uniref:Uncharacterized protein n=1 Tax=Candidatus Bealeia paramacronuclearis TaxID=1921001 RepID=A0ABZ2C5R7_9PROT|nr:hypothetical protein [Candidatus Bealeia paramacronuclearis]
MLKRFFMALSLIMFGWTQQAWCENKCKTVQGKPDAQQFCESLCGKDNWSTHYSAYFPDITKASDVMENACKNINAGEVFLCGCDK